MCADDAVFADDGTVQERTAYANQGIVADSAAMQHDFVADGDTIADRERNAGIGMQDGAVLNVASLADFDPVVIAAHGNSLRALVKMLDEVSDDEITGFNIPTGVPLAYDLDDDLKPRSREFLGDPEAVAKAAAAVAAQGKAQ